MDKEYLSGLAGESYFETRLFSGFAFASASATPSPQEMFEPPFCSELLARKIEYEHEQSKKMNNSLMLLKNKMMKSKEKHKKE